MNPSAFINAKGGYLAGRSALSHQNQTKDAIKNQMAMNKRRYDSNADAWSLQAISSNKLRSESSIAKMKHTKGSKHSNYQQINSSSAHHHILDDKQQVSCTDTMRNSYISLKSYIVDNWRRATKSQNDPYVHITLKPTSENTVAESFRTNKIVGGGGSVAWNSEYDDNEYTFLLGKDENPLKNKYLKIEVFDYETGTKDRLLGTSHVAIKRLTQINQKYYAKLDLIGDKQSNYQWSGSVHISATFQQLNEIEQQAIIQKQNELDRQQSKRLSFNPLRANTAYSVKRQQSESIMLNRIKSTTSTPKYAGLDRIATEIFLDEQKNPEKDEEDVKMSEQLRRIIKANIVNFFLFLSLMLSGALFYGVTNLYEVEAQTIYMYENFGAPPTMIDSFRWGIVTMSTVGYGDYYPQTTGGKIFGSFFAIFSVSLLARLLSNIGVIIGRRSYIKRRERNEQRRLCSTSAGYMKDFDEDGDGVITNFEYLKIMLLKSDLVDEDKIHEIMEIFSKYDKDGDGSIDTEELKDYIRNHNTDDNTEDNNDETVNNNQQNDTTEFEMVSNKYINLQDVCTVLDKNLFFNDHSEKTKLIKLFEEYCDNNSIKSKTFRNAISNCYYNNDDDDEYMFYDMLDDMDYELEKRYEFYHIIVHKYIDFNQFSPRNLTCILTKIINKFDNNIDIYDIEPIVGNNILSGYQLKILMTQNNMNKFVNMFQKLNIKQKHWIQIWNVLQNWDNIKYNKFGVNVVTQHDMVNFAEYGLKVEVLAADDLKESEYVDAEDSFWSFIIGWSAFIIYLGISAMIFSFVEDANYGEMLWFAVITTCTVGYGDVRPETTEGKIINAFFISTSVVIFVAIFSSTMDYIYHQQEKATAKKKKNNMEDMAKKCKTLWEVYPTNNQKRKENNKKTKTDQIKTKNKLKVFGDELEYTEEEKNFLHNGFSANNNSTKKKKLRRKVKQTSQLMHMIEECDEYSTNTTKHKRNFSISNDQEENAFIGKKQNKRSNKLYG